MAADGGGGGDDDGDGALVALVTGFGNSDNFGHFKPSYQGIHTRPADAGFDVQSICSTSAISGVFIVLQRYT